MRPRRVFPLLLVALPALVALRFPLVPESLHLTALELSKPVYTLLDGFGDRVRSSGRMFGELLHARKENARLQSDVSGLRSQIIRSSELEKENQRLRDLLAFRDRFGVSGSGARVIGRSPSQWFQLIVLDKGSKEGLTKQTVLVTSAGLAGRVFEVGPSASRAVLLTDPEFRAGALGQDSRDMGVVFGTGGARVAIHYLPLDTKLRVGEVVVTSGLGGVFPKGLPIGRVNEVGVHANRLESVASIEPFVDFNHLEEVLCIPFPEDL